MRIRFASADYRGPDRRRIIPRQDRGSTRRAAAAVLAAVGAVPAAIAWLLSLAPPEPIRSWATGIGDASFVAFCILSLLLFIEWRLAGYALAVYFSAAALLIALFVVPGTSFRDGNIIGDLQGGRLAAITVVLVLCLHARRGPEVNASLSPGRVVISTVVASLLLAVLLVVSVHPTTGGGLVDLVDAVAAGAAGVLLLVDGLSRCQTVIVGLGGTLLSLAGACACLAASHGTPRNGWTIAPNLFLLAGGVQALLFLSADVNSLITAVARRDVRGRRRWEAAEDQLTKIQHRYQGQSHDIRSMLSGVDGTLLMLLGQRDQLSSRDSDALVVAIREQIHWLQALLTGDDGEIRPYDLSEMLRAIVRVRAEAGQSLACEIENGIVVHGRPDRLAIVVTNLLANAATHAPSAPLTLTARRQMTTEGRFVEIAVADEGSGLADADLRRAFERGWRGSDAADRPGSGLGLFQCRQLVAAEAGLISLVTTHPSAPPGKRGLTARTLIPEFSAATPDGVQPVFGAAHAIPTGGSEGLQRR